MTLVAAKHSPLPNMDLNVNPVGNDSKIPVAREENELSYWSIFIPGAKELDHYKFVISRKDQS